MQLKFLGRITVNICYSSFPLCLLPVYTTFLLPDVPHKYIPSRAIPTYEIPLIISYYKFCNKLHYILEGVGCQVADPGPKVFHLILVIHVIHLLNDLLCSTKMDNIA